MPSGLSASTIAFITEVSAPAQPAPPQPLTPSELPVPGPSSRSQSTPVTISSRPERAYCMDEPICAFPAAGPRRAGARPPAHHRRARAASAGADHELIGIALHQPHAAEGNAQPGNQYLRERRRVPLPVVERPADERDAALVLEPDAAHLLVRRRGDFHVAADAEAAQPAARLGLFLPPGKAGDIAGL